MAPSADLISGSYVLTPLGTLGHCEVVKLSPHPGTNEDGSVCRRQTPKAWKLTPEGKAGALPVLMAARLG